MNAIASPDPQDVRLRSRLACITLIWLLATIGLAIGFLRSPTGSGYDPLTEFPTTVLQAPFLAVFGLTYLLAGPTAPTVVGLIAFFIGLIALIAMTVAMIRARERKVFIRIAFAYALIVGVALFGYYRFAYYWELHSHA